MIKSMTGFGKAIVELVDKRIIVEIKALNSKQLDCNIKMPVFYKEKEPALRSSIAKRLERGKIDLFFTVELTGTAINYSINKPLFINYHNELKTIVKDINIDVNTDYINIIMRLPDILQIKQQELKEGEWSQIKDAVDKAINELDKFRINEGSVLEQDIIKRVTNISYLLTSIKQYENERINAIKEKIQKGLKGIIEENKIDKNRFEQELIYYIEKLDITEEKIRLKSHCDYFAETLKENKSQGKKLSFIVQEMGREINTIGSKANNVDIQKVVVQMKDELEKIKEQLMNVL